MTGADSCAIARGTVVCCSTGYLLQKRLNDHVNTAQLYRLRRSVFALFGNSGWFPETQHPGTAVVKKSGPSG